MSKAIFETCPKANRRLIVTWGMCMGTVTKTGQIASPMRQQQLTS